jgi:hypothetical protein
VSTRQSFIIRELFFKNHRWIRNNPAAILERTQMTAPRPMEVTDMLMALFVVLLAACLVAPWLGVDTSDSRSEEARPVQGWFPLLSRR